MKRLFAALALLLCAAPLFAQSPGIPEELLAPRRGFQHTHICTDASWGCGSNPPTFQIPADGYTPGTGPDSGRHVGCGTIYSTSHARNTDGSISTKGVRIQLPTVAMMGAAGINAPFRDGQCEIQIVMGAPGPQQYLRLAINGINPDDKMTVIPGGAGDSNVGEIWYPYRTPGVISLQFNGVSWLVNHVTPDIAELVGNGQLAAHGQNRLFLVTQDPSWNTVGTLVGKLALCPTNGNGVIGPSNGGDMLVLNPYTCTFHTPTAGGPAMEWITLGFNSAGTATGITQGAAYAAGTAPDGTVYPAGNYVTVTGATGVSLESGNTYTIFNGSTALGTVINGRWIGKVVGSTIELHEEITPDGVSAPSSFIAGDSMTSGIIKYYGPFLSTQGTATARQQWVADGAEIQGGTTRRTIVGLAQRGPTGFSGTYQDTATLRTVSSLFQPREKSCGGTYTADRTTTSATFVQPAGSSEVNCSFVHLDRNGSIAKTMGDTSGSAVKWRLNMQASNNTASAGCDATVAFDGVAEATFSGFVNPAGVTGAKNNVGASGTKTGLTETGLHTATVMLRAVGGGTCTAYSGASLALTVWQ